MKKGKIGLGIIGMGRNNMGSTFMLLEKEPGLRYAIRSICAVPRPEVEKTARHFGVPHWTDNFRELVRRSDVDVVCVFSPDHLHAQHCIAALEAGKHVVCTKPMVTRLADAQKMVKLVKQKKVKFLVGQTMRFDRQFLAARKYFDNGDLGEIIALESYYVHDMRPVFKLTPWRLKVPQDLMFGGCVHSIDVIRAFGGEIESVQAFAKKDDLTPEYPIPDNFFINLKFKSGAIGRVSGLYGIVHPPTPMMQFGIYGTKGSLQSEFTDNEPGQLRVVLDKFAGHKPRITNYGKEQDLSAYGHGATVMRYMRHFQDCLDKNIDPSPSVLDGAKSVAAGAAAWKSIKTGKVVKVNTVFA
jgi:predicted dehydrogenase